MPTTASARRSVADRYTLCQRHSGWRIPHFARTRTLGALPGCQHRPQSDAERTGKCERRSRFPVANGGMLVQPCQAQFGIGSGTHPRRRYRQLSPVETASLNTHASHAIPGAQKWARFDDQRAPEFRTDLNVVGRILEPGLSSQRTVCGSEGLALLAPCRGLGRPRLHRRPTAELPPTRPVPGLFAAPPRTPTRRTGAGHGRNVCRATP